MSIPNIPQPPPPSPHYNSPYNNNNNKKYTEEDYEEIYYHFDDYSQDIILANASKFLVPPEPAEDYEWEEMILDEASQDEWEGMKKSLLFGVGCGVAGFVGLRWRRIRGVGGGSSSFGGGGLSKYASSSSMQKPTRSSGGYTFDPIPKPNAMQQQQMNMNMMQQQNQQHFNNANQGSGGLLMDISLATLLGMGTTLLALQTDIFYPSTTAISISSDEEKTTISIMETKPPPPQWISETIPLVPGRSMISDTLCKPLTNEFRKFPKELWQSGNKNRGIENGYNNHMALYANSGWKGTKHYEGNDNASLEMLGEHGTGSDGSIEGGSVEQQQQGMYEHLLLDSLQGFIINCERRARQENKIRKLRGLREHVPVAIPYGGVDADEDLELDVYFEKSHDEDDNEGFGL